MITFLSADGLLSSIISLVLNYFIKITIKRVLMEDYIKSNLEDGVAL
ncbi:unnamed protein product, partial [marine sediment metagenome]